MNQDNLASPKQTNAQGQTSPQPAPEAPQSPSAQPVQAPSQSSPVINIQTPAPSTASQPAPEVVVPAQEKPIKPALNLAQEKEKIANKLGVLAGIIFGTIETSLALRLIFKLLGANPNNVFIKALYQFTRPFVAPFIGIFSLDLSFASFSLDVPTIIAMIIYSLIGYALLWATRLL